MFSNSDQLRCSLVLQNEKSQSTKFVMSYADGEPVDSIDIGQDDWEYSWPKKYLTWKFLDHTPDMRASEQKTALQAAFNSVEKLTELTLHFERNNHTKTDITVEWLEDLSVFDNKETVLAHAYLYHPKGSKNGVMEWNDSEQSRWHFTPLGHPVEAYLVDPVNYHKGEKWSNGQLKMLATQSTVHIGMHELGHILGLRHDLVDQDAIMYPYAKRGYLGHHTVNKSAFEWHYRDVARLESRYGTSNIPIRWLRRWQARRVMRHIYER